MHATTRGCRLTLMPGVLSSARSVRARVPQTAALPASLPRLTRSSTADMAGSANTPGALEKTPCAPDRASRRERKCEQCQTPAGEPGFRHACSQRAHVLPAEQPSACDKCSMKAFLPEAWVTRSRPAPCELTASSCMACLVSAFSSGGAVAAARSTISNMGAARLRRVPGSTRLPLAAVPRKDTST